MGDCYYHLNGLSIGPLTPQHLLTAARLGTIRGDTLVWTPGCPHWVPFEQWRTSPLAKPGHTPPAGTPIKPPPVPTRPHLQDSAPPRQGSPQVQFTVPKPTVAISAPPMRVVPGAQQRPPASQPISRLPMAPNQAPPSPPPPAQPQRQGTVSISIPMRQTSSVPTGRPPRISTSAVPMPPPPPPPQPRQSVPLSQPRLTGSVPPAPPPRQATGPMPLSPPPRQATGSVPLAQPPRQATGPVPMAQPPRQATGSVPLAQPPRQATASVPLAQPPRQATSAVPLPPRVEIPGIQPLPAPPPKVFKLGASTAGAAPPPQPPPPVAGPEPHAPIAAAPVLRVVRQTSMTPPPTVPALRKTNAVPPPPAREAVPGPMMPLPIAPPGPLQPPPPEPPRAVVFEGTEELRIAATIPPTPPRRRRASDPPPPPPVAEPEPAFDPSGLRLTAAPEQVMDVASQAEPQVDIIPNKPTPSAPVPIRPAAIAPRPTAEETAEEAPAEDGIRALLKNPVNLVLISLAALLFLAFLLLKIGVI